MSIYLSEFVKSLRPGSAPITNEEFVVEFAVDSILGSSQFTRTFLTYERAKQYAQGSQDVAEATSGVRPGYKITRTLKEVINEVL